MKMFTIDELTQVLNDYIKSNYDYDYADVFEDEIVIHLYDNKLISVSINVDYDEEVNENE